MESRVVPGAEVERPAAAPQVLIDADGNEVGFLVGRGEYAQLMELLARRRRSRLPVYWRRAVQSHIRPVGFGS
jgi:hypothetical protein